ncbi:low molecular weight phosphatase family protein [Longibacter salinarum]|uniref:Low molecular weight phosphatase family protein n=1 Tax=Longibacter salinarum TaxID=1850348 RepID=A0A2A8D079_9BACT|nr:arsenate reductase ArsC [Longibacter salinarum]PEN14294.1 low molecular weight phosphatase family protein [Longibacter salinarum]
MTAQDTTRVLFVCTANAARSQMAEALLRARGGDAYSVYSAGSEPTEVHPLAVEAMADLDIDLTGHRSESLDTYRDDVFDYVITLCAGTRDVSPSIRANEMVIHRPFDDPDGYPEAKQPQAFRRIRDEIADWIDQLFLLQAA